MKIDDIFDKIIEKFRKSKPFEVVSNYHRVNGMLPDIGTSISLGCSKVRYTDYDNQYDEVSAQIMIYIYTQEADPELGERKIRELSENARGCITKDRTLDGIVVDFLVDEIEYIYADSSSSMFWHAAVLTSNVLYYQAKV